MRPLKRGYPACSPACTRQHALEDVAVDGCVFGVRRPQLFQLGFLLEAGEASALPTPPPGDALFERGVVEHTAAPEHRVQCLLLPGRRAQLLPVGLA